MILEGAEGVRTFRKRKAVFFIPGKRKNSVKGCSNSVITLHPQTQEKEGERFLCKNQPKKKRSKGGIEGRASDNITRERSGRE